MQFIYDADAIFLLCLLIYFAGFVWVPGILEKLDRAKERKNMAFPETRDGLKKQGYRYQELFRCKGCGEEVENWNTPRGLRMRMDRMPRGDSPARAHFAACAGEPLFRQAR